LQAQQPETRRVEGRVVLPAAFLGGDTSAVVTVPDILVTLHRVSPSLSGPLDSMRTDGEGRYQFRYLPSGGAEAVYFVSAMYGGIAYFTNPLRELVTTGADAEIAVFDTTSTAFPLTVRGRHLIVGSLDSARERTVVEIFELSNDSTRTIVALETPDALPTWSFVVPEAAREVKAGQGDLPADAFVQSTGKVALYAAMAPGLKQLSVSYKLPESAFPLELPIEAGAVVLEVLLEEPEATVQGANLVAVEPVGLEGRQFLRFLAQDVRGPEPGDDPRSLFDEDPRGGARANVTCRFVQIGRHACSGVFSWERMPVRVSSPTIQTPCTSQAAAVSWHLLVPARAPARNRLVRRCRRRPRVRLDFRRRPTPMISARRCPLDARFAERVVSLNPTATEAIFAIGAEAVARRALPVGSVPRCRRGIPASATAFAPPSKPCSRQRPTLVILYATAENRGAAEALARAGVRTLALRVDRIAQFHAQLRTLGVALGAQGARAR
jgi:hypothetical protein